MIYIRCNYDVYRVDAFGDSSEGAGGGGGGFGGTKIPSPQDFH